MRKTFGYGFTLVEMLIVIGVIGILAALLMPSLQNALESSRGISCCNQLKQISLAIFTYDQDHNVLPNSSEFATRVIYAYIVPQAVTNAQKVLPHLCPKSDYLVLGYGGYKWTEGSYSYTRHAGSVNYTTGVWYDPPVRLAQVKRPSGKYFDIDGGGCGWFNYSALSSSSYPQNGQAYPGLWFTDTVRSWHNLRTNCVFADGHANAEVINFSSNIQARKVADLTY